MQIHFEFHMIVAAICFHRPNVRSSSVLGNNDLSVATALQTSLPPAEVQLQHRDSEQLSQYASFMSQNLKNKMRWLR